ncbi:MAG: hypothetical protein HKP61_23215 [Dactylosporangium sp.]|nr:hypothetical protein [Dactylosporangium sp.]
MLSQRSAVNPTSPSPGGQDATTAPWHHTGLNDPRDRMSSVDGTLLAEFTGTAQQTTSGYRPIR